MKKLFSALMLWLLTVLPMMAGIAVYFDNSTTQWSTVRLHHWGSGLSNITWGSAPEMTKVEGQENLYMFTINTTTDGKYNFLFHNYENNGVTSQSDDITDVTEDNLVYCPQSSDNKFSCTTKSLSEWIAEHGGSQGGEGQQPQVDWPVLYLRGECNSWGSPDEYKFDVDKNGNYSLTLASLSDRFVIATGGDDWSVKYGAQNQVEGSNYGPALTAFGTYTLKKQGPDFGSDTNLSNVKIQFTLSDPKSLPDNLSVTFSNANAQGGTEPEEPDPGTEYYVLYDNSKTLWTTPYVWAWDTNRKNLNNEDWNCCNNSSNGIGSWPGDAMTRIDEENNIWKWVADPNNIPTGILFSNNGTEGTVSADFIFENGKTYGEKAEQGGNEPEEPATNDKERVYYRNTDGWSEVCAYAYNGGTNCTNNPNGWPGDEMTYLEDCGLWYWEVPSGKPAPAYVIFNNNNSGQQHPASVGFKYVKGHIYNSAGDTGETSNAAPTQGGSQGGGETSGLTVTGTLPVLYINVYADAEKTTYDNNVTDYNLRDKDYRAGEFWLTVPVGEEYQWMVDLGFEGVGSEEEPLALEIKARGNATRTGFSKKPFKLKLGKKANLLGLTPAKSKHYALLAHADDDNGFMRNFVGFNLGKRIGLPWTPGMQPVEVVINGDYRGLYFLTESIRVGDGRIDIQELKDQEESVSLISGGYLVEFDNYPQYVEENPTLPKKLDTQIWVEEGTTQQPMYINFDTPEVLSAIQKDFLVDQFQTMNSLIRDNSNDLWSYLDLDDAARYYVIMEICSHWEAYHGSTYLYRDRGEGQKWHFSPLWDMGHAFGGPTNEFFYQNAMYGNTWIKDLKRNTKFNDKVAETWQWFINRCYPGLLQDMEAYCAHISTAAANDWQRWKDVPMPDYYDNANVWGGNDPKPVVNNSDMDAKYQGVVDHLNAKIGWLKGVWGDANIDEPARDTTEPAPLPDWAKAPELPNVDGVASKTLPVVFIATKQPEAEKTYDVYFDNSEKNWSEVAVWAWSSTANCTTRGTWPGDKMTDLGNGLWGWDVPKTDEPQRIMFNNNVTPGTESTAGDEGAFYYTKGATYNFNGRMGNVPLVVPVEPTAAEIGYGDEGALAGTIVIRDLDSDLDILGSAEAPVDIEAVKGTGTFADWNAYDKKAYKVKLASKAKGGVLGMSPNGSKHWSLLPYVDDAANGLLTNYAAHLFAEAVGLHWTPGMAPVELVIDGDYKGLYFLVETIHIDDDRINNVTDYDKKAFSLGDDWLIEFNDNAADADRHYTFGEGENQHHVTSHSPALSLTDDELAAAFNKNYTGPKDGAALRTVLGESVDELLNAASSASADNISLDWEGVIDPIQAARYYVVQEVMDASDAFNTSFYAYHGKGGKWMLGPVWNFSNANAQGGNKSGLLHQGDDFNGSIIANLWDNLYFQKYVKHIFTVTCLGGTAEDTPGHPEKSMRREAGTNKFQAVLNQVTAMGESLEAAAYADAQRWGDYADYAATSEGNSVSARANVLRNNLARNINYLYNSKAENGAGWFDESLTGIDTIISDSTEAGFIGAPVYYDLTGRRIERPAAGVYIERRGNSVRKVVIK